MRLVTLSKENCTERMKESSDTDKKYQIYVINSSGDVRGACLTHCRLLAHPPNIAHNCRAEHQERAGQFYVQGCHPFFLF